MSEKRRSAGETERMADWNYGCLFCRSGAEDQIIGIIERWHPEIEAISAKRVRVRRTGNTTAEELAVLFPGYIFFRTREDTSFREFLWVENTYRMLKDMDGNWRLSGRDREIAKRLFDAGGIIGFSKAYYAGDRIRILDGFLKDYEGYITRVNRRARTAEIRVTLNGKVLDVWLGFELVEEQPALPDAEAQPEVREADASVVRP